jgi:hypothetical protein
MYGYDARDEAAARNRGYKEDHEKMVMVVEVEDLETGEESTVEVPAEYEVCGLCNGKGKHVNPSIDAHGLSSEDFAEDPDFAEEYFSGFYDISCNECGGRRVVLTPRDDLNKEQQDAIDHMYDVQEIDREFRAEVEAERRMGA